MTPREFLDQIVCPNMAAFDAPRDHLRHAFNAVTAVDALAAHIYNWASANKPEAVEGALDDSAYREILANRDGQFRLLRDMAKAQKHVRLTRGNPQVLGADQFQARALGWGDGAWGEMRWGGGPQAVVDVGGEEHVVEAIAKRALAFLDAVMAGLGI